MASHAELDDARLRLIRAFRTDTNQTRLPFLQRLSHRLQHRRLRAAAADPTFDGAVGMYDRLRARLRRGRRFAAHYRHDGKRFASRFQLAGAIQNRVTVDHQYASWLFTIHRKDTKSAKGFLRETTLACKARGFRNSRLEADRKYVAIVDRKTVPSPACGGRRGWGPSVRSPTL